MEKAENFGSNAWNQVPAGWKPEISLEQSLLDMDGSAVKVCESWHRNVPGEGDFPSRKALIQHSKLFVQQRVAFGDELPPQYIFALHLYTIPCNLFSKCCAAMRGNRNNKGVFTMDEESLNPYQTFI